MSAQSETIASVYANALLDLAFEKGVHSEVLAELRAFGELLDQVEDFANFLNTPRIRQQVKKEKIQKVFGGQVSDHTLHFLQLVLDKGRQIFLPRIIREYQDGYHDRMGELVVRVQTAVSLQDGQRNRLSALLKKRFEKEIILLERTNPRLLGGLVLRVGDSRIDGSLKTRLEAIGSRLEASRFLSEEYYEN